LISINAVVLVHFDVGRRMTNIEVSKQAFSLAVGVSQ